MESWWLSRSKKKALKGGRASNNNIKKFHTGGAPPFQSPGHAHPHTDCIGLFPAQCNANQVCQWCTSISPSNNEIAWCQYESDVCDMENWYIGDYWQWDDYNWPPGYGQCASEGQTCGGNWNVPSNQCCILPPGGGSLQCIDNICTQVFTGPMPPPQNPQPIKGIKGKTGQVRSGPFLGPGPIIGPTPPITSIVGKTGNQQIYDQHQEGETGWGGMGYDTEGFWIMDAMGSGWCPPGCNSTCTNRCWNTSNQTAQYDPDMEGSGCMGAPSGVCNCYCRYTDTNRWEPGEYGCINDGHCPTGQCCRGGACVRCGGASAGWKGSTQPPGFAGPFKKGGKVRNKKGRKRKK